MSDSPTMMSARDAKRDFDPKNAQRIRGTRWHVTPEEGWRADRPTDKDPDHE